MSIAVAPKMEEIVESRSLFAPERPITFDEFLEWFGPDDDVELIDGVAQRRMAAQLDHERLSVFLVRLIGDFAEEAGIGEILASRVAVRIGQFRGRLPDVLFVRNENVAKLEQKGLRFAPDLVIEIVSPGDRVSDIFALESDYRHIGVAEIVFIDQRRHLVRVLRRVAGGDSDALQYDEETLGPGESLSLSCLDDVALPTDWLFVEPRPTVRAALATWASPSAGD